MNQQVCHQAKQNSMSQHMLLCQYIAEQARQAMDYPCLLVTFSIVVLDCPIASMFNHIGVWTQ